MTTTELLALHDDLCTRGKEIMTSKNHDYTGGGGDPFANFRGSTALGVDPIVGILLRVQDKMQRIKTFAEKGELKVKGESVKDALIDTINYMILIGGLIEDSQEEDFEFIVGKEEEVEIIDQEEIAIRYSSDGRAIDSQGRPVIQVWDSSANDWFWVLEENYEEAKEPAPRLGRVSKVGQMKR